NATVRPYGGPAETGSARTPPQLLSARDILLLRGSEKIKDPATNRETDSEDVPNRRDPDGSAAKRDDDKPPERNGDREDDSAKRNGNKKPRFDAAVVSAGEAAFNRSCTTCHDAQRSFAKTKSLSGWRASVLRMAGKTGADIASSDVEPIATYLASRNSSGTSG